MSVVSKWRTLTVLREHVRHQPLSNASIFSDDELTAMVEDAEDFVLSPGVDETIWLDKTQRAFDVAVKAMIELWGVNPDMAKKFKDGALQRDYAEEVPYSVRTFWANYATGTLPGQDEVNFVVGKFDC